jgi:16S rRNA (guanine1207-N2)-methyltransferase
VRFATVWSNPPIRVGKAELHSMLTTWLGRLAVGGTAVLVVQKHLGADSLTRWLNESGWPTRRLQSRASFRLLEASGPA